MKKGISVYTEYDNAGRWCLKIEKAKGTLKLQEIIDTAREYEYDFYLLVLDCFHDEDPEFQQEGDVVTLYRTDLLYEEGEH